MRFEKSIDIDAPQQRAWDVLSDLEAWPQRIETVDTVELLTPAPIGTGSRVRLKQPKLPEGVWEITTWDAPAYFEWTQKMTGTTTVAGHRVESLGDGRSRPVLQGPDQPLHDPRGRGHEARSRDDLTAAGDRRNGKRGGLAAAYLLPIR